MAGVKKFLDFFVKVEPETPSGPSGATLSDEELQKILAEEEGGAKPAPAKGRPSAPAGPAGGGARGSSPPPRPSAPMAPPAMQQPRVRDVAAPVIARMPSSPQPPSGNAPAGTGELPDFPTVYQLAKVPAPAHGYSIDKVESMLANPRLQGMAPSIKANSVLMALEVAGVPIADVVADAVARDKAIDDFEGWWAAKVATIESEKRSENAAIEEEMNRYLEQQRERIRNNNAAVQQAQETFSQWLVLKGQEEQRLYNAVAPFVTENPVTLDTGSHRGQPAGGEAPFQQGAAPKTPGKK